MVTKAWSTSSTEDRGDAVLSVLSSGDALEYTVGEVAAALNLPAEAKEIQSLLEDLVHRGALLRRGVGHGALYSRVTPPSATSTLIMGASGIQEPASHPLP